MRRINPLLLLVLILLLFVVEEIFIKHEKDKEEIIQKELQANTQMAKQIVSYKKIWENKKLYDKKLQHFLRSLNAKHINFTKNIFSNYITLNFAKVNFQSATYVLSTLLNQNFKIKSLNINKIDDNKLKLFIEVIK